METLQFLKDFCLYFYYAHSLPVYLFQKKEQLVQYPPLPEDMNPVSIYLSDLLSSEDKVSFLVTRQFIYYGLVRITDTDLSVIIGPITSTLSSADTIIKIMHDASISNKKTNEFTEFFQQIPILSYSHFLNVLVYMNFICNREHVSTDDLLDIQHHKYEIPISEIHTVNNLITKEEQIFHNTYRFEQEYLSYIETGNLIALKEKLSSPFTLRTGMVADNNIRQTKNLAVVSTTLATRSAVKGGLDIETAYQLSDTYIREMERLQDYNAINTLQLKMILDFTSRVMEAKLPSGISPILYECIQYASAHTNEPITVTDIAKHVNLSRSHLSRKFKEEMGFDLSSFIMRCKLEEARSLLTFSDKSIGEISSYLYFSSQSYFQNVFKEKYGMTPKSYRENKHLK